MVRHSSRQLESLIALAATVAGAHRLEDVLELAATRARDALGNASVSISRWEVENGCLRTLINVGDDEDRWPEDEVYPLDEFPAAVDLLRQGRPHLARADDPETDPAEHKLLLETGMASSAAVPIVYQGRRGASSTPPPRTAARCSTRATSTTWRRSAGRSASRSGAPSCSPGSPRSPSRTR